MRELIGSFDRQFADLHSRSCELTLKTGNEMLYSRPNERPQAIGELVVRSAACVEQMIGGITTRLWDDPFEWTLPEQLSTPATVLAHLAEVEETRKQAFGSFTDDSCLLKSIATPADGLVSLIELLLRTLLRAAHYQSRAAAALNALSGISPSGLII